MKQMIYLILFSLIVINGCAQQGKHHAENMKDSKYYRPLTAQEERVIIHKGTERPFTGKYEKFYEEGTYICKRCGAELYSSSDKFDSGCGWPSFDDEIKGAVTRTPDPDGMRTEITCTNCGAHLGHVFLNEGFTAKNTRHCVNSISLEFIPAGTSKMASSDTAYFAGGCFWGVEYYLEQSPGVISAEDGYIGGHIKNPSYEQVCRHTTGFAEAVMVVFDPSETSFEKLARLFFEIHDPTQLNRQGPDIGDQYSYEIFYRTEEQKEIAQKLIDILKMKGYEVVTRLTPASDFYKAENYHQDHYKNTGETPYCHKYTKRF